MTTYLEFQHLWMKGKDSPSMTLTTWEVTVAASCYPLPCVIVSHSAAERGSVVPAMVIGSASTQCRCSFEKEVIGCSKDCAVVFNQAGTNSV